MSNTLSKIRPASRKRVASPGRAELKLRRILVPMDFSGQSRQALLCAVPLARKCRAKISLVHVTPSPVVMNNAPDGSIHLPVDVADVMNEVKTRLDELASHLLPDHLRDRTVVREGNAALGVVAAAKALKADLIVLSTNGRSGLKRFVLGSTAERIVRHAQCPLLTVRRQGGQLARRMLSGAKPVYAKQLPWRRILVPLDFSFSSLRALTVATTLARASGARLLLLNVVEPNPYPAGMEGSLLAMPDAVAAKNARVQLPRVVRRFVPRTVPVTSLVEHGHAASVIVRTAAERAVDLIVLATHGHTGLGQLLLGSTAEQIVRHAKCPVFVARKPAVTRKTQTKWRN